MNVYLKCYVIAITLSFAFSLPVQLSEDVLQRMRGVANIPPERSSSSTSVPKKDTGIFFVIVFHTVTPGRTENH